MIQLGPATRVFLAAGPTDMRKGFDGMADLVRHRLAADPLNGHLYRFCNRRKTRLKILCFVSVTRSAISQSGAHLGS
jgi:transposase